MCAICHRGNQQGISIGIDVQRPELEHVEPYQSGAWMHQFVGRDRQRILQSNTRCCRATPAVVDRVGEHVRAMVAGSGGVGHRHAVRVEAVPCVPFSPR